MKYNFNYKLKFQVSLHLHHLSEVRARCPSGAHAVRVWPARGAHMARPCARAVRVWLAGDARLARPWCARGARLAHPRCARGARLARPQCTFGTLATSSHGSWSLNHQTSRISPLSS